MLKPLRSAKMGGPMRGLELIMWPEGQWEAWNWSCDLRANERPPKKLHPMAQNHTHTHRQTVGHGKSMTESDQRGRFSENGTYNDKNILIILRKWNVFFPHKKGSKKSKMLKTSPLYHCEKRYIKVFWIIFGKLFGPYPDANKQTKTHNLCT